MERSEDGTFLPLHDPDREIHGEDVLTAAIGVRVRLLVGFSFPQPERVQPNTLSAARLVESCPKGLDRHYEQIQPNESGEPVRCESLGARTSRAVSPRQPPTVTRERSKLSSFPSTIMRRRETWKSVWRPLVSSLSRGTPSFLPLPLLPLEQLFYFVNIL